MKGVPAKHNVILDESGLADVTVLANRQPGKGDAMRRLMVACGYAQGKLAMEMGVNRATISAWVSETRWPSDEEIKQACLLMGIPRDQIVQAWMAAPRQAGQEDVDLAKQLQQLLWGETRALKRKLIIGRTMEEEVFIRQAFRAREDVRAAQLFFSRLDQYEDQARHESIETVNVTPQQAGWAQGTGVYEPRAADVVPPIVEDVSGVTWLDDEDEPTPPSAPCREG